MIKGITKSVAYDVGDPFEEVKTLSNKWVAVHVNGDWRIIFPLWAFSAVEGRITDNYIFLLMAINIINNYKINHNNFCARLFDYFQFCRFEFESYVNSLSRE